MPSSGKTADTAGEGEGRTPASLQGAKGPYFHITLGILECLLLTFLVFSAVRHWEHEQRLSEFHTQADARVIALRGEIEKDLETLDYFAAFHTSRLSSDPEAPRAFAGKTLLRHPSVQALVWVDAEITAGRGDSRPMPSPGSLREVFAGAESALGLDPGVLPPRRSEFEKAREIGGMVLTGRLRLVQDTKQFDGFLAILPIYQGGDVPDSPAARMTKLRGYAVGAFRIRGIVSHALAAFPPGEVDLVLLDRTARAENQPLHPPVDPARSEEVERRIASARGGLHESAFLDIGARRWEILILPSPSFLARRMGWQSGSVLFAGLFFTAILGGYLFSLRGRTRQTEKLVEERTRALSGEVRIRKAAERTLSTTLGIQRAILDGANHSIISTTPHGTILTFNRASERWLGHRAEEVIGRGVTDLCYDAEEIASRAGTLSKELGVPIEPGFEAVVAKARRGIPDEKEWTYLRKDGSRFPVLLSVTALTDESGAISGFLEIASDVSERKRSEERFRSVVEASPSGMILTNREGRILLVNRCAEKILGYERAELAGKLIDDLIPTEALPLHPTQREAYFQNPYELDMSARRDLSARRKDGTMIPVEIGLSPIQSDQGLLVMASFLDITGRKRQENALRAAMLSAEDASRAKSTFLANMSHELRTPLNSIIGFSNLLLKNKSGNLARGDLTFLERIAENGKHLLLLINTILDLSKIEAGRMELERIETSLPALLQETAELLQGDAADKEIRLVVEASEEARPERTDPGKLKQVLINLVGNALKFTEKGTVTLRLVVEPATREPLSIEVRDEGIGIPMEKLGTIFEAFAQADAGASRRHGGTGLGLTISRSLCERMGYALEVESEVGRGSVFRVRFFPPSPGAAETQGPAPLGLTYGAGKLILLIDDEADSRLLLSREVQEMGFRAIEAATGEEGISLARSARPDVIALDLVMPGMSGWEVLRLLQADPQLSGIPVVIVSLLAHELRGSITGNVEFLTKPVDRNRLFTALHRVLA